MTSTSGKSDDWTVLEKQHEGFPLLVRLRQFTEEAAGLERVWGS